MAAIGEAKFPMTEKGNFVPVLLLSTLTSVMVSLATGNVFWGMAALFGLWFIAFMISAAAQRIVITLIERR